MSFHETSETAANVAQVAAVVIGGLWAYIKFIRGRTFRRRGELAVTGTVMKLGSGRAILIKVTFTNTGLSWMRFDSPDQKGVFVFALHRRDWHPELDQNVSWGEDLMRSVALRDHNWVEPGEVVSDEILLPAGSGDPEPIAFQVIARVTIKRRSLVFWRRRGPEWTARVVLPYGMEIASGGTGDESLAPRQMTHGGPSARPIHPNQSNI